jgi:HD-GYP domain-containing protein (c-di-GMP phosphodiesterase class II)
MNLGRLSYLLIMAGVIIMALCVLKYRENVEASNGILKKNGPKIALLSGFHQIVIMFLFLGYIILFYYENQGVKTASSFYVVVIFFFGTISAMIGILLQADMLASVKSRQSEIEKVNHQLVQTERVTIYALAYQAELRDMETGKHLERTSKYVELLAEKLALVPKYRSYLSPVYIADLVTSAPLHDIGKVAIPDSILRKPGKLTPEEFEIIKKHCEYGTKVLKIADEKLSFQSFLKIAIQMVSSHHERWDGKGYPAGLCSDSIPLSGRIMALADVYDALRSERCYKKAFSHEETCKIIARERATRFDPDLIDAFFEIEKRFHEISIAMTD